MSKASPPTARSVASLTPNITPRQSTNGGSDAPDEVAQYRTQEAIDGTEVGSSLSIPLTVENRIIGMLSLFDEVIGTFDTDMLKLTTMIADYAAVALENTESANRGRLAASARPGKTRPGKTKSLSAIPASPQTASVNAGPFNYVPVAIIRVGYF